MRNILVTGGTVFVSKYIAQYYAGKGEQVYVLNRNTHPQPEHTILIEGDRHQLGNKLKNYKFDAVIDVNAYNEKDITSLLDALGEFEDYIFISSSAVYPETNLQPFAKTQQVGKNRFWGQYGTDKIAAEQALQRLYPKAYIIRPPYLYGPMNNVYREAFVFDCAMAKRKFYLPREGEMKLQFFHVEDLCRFIDAILEQKPRERIFNVGNPESVTVKDWVEMCYEAAGASCECIPVHAGVNQREYFSFYDYEYKLDVTGQKKLLPDTKELREGLRECFRWYEKHTNEVGKKPYLQFIDRELDENGNM